MFNKLDLFILDRIFNPISIKLYKRYGISTFGVAKSLMMLGTSFLFLLVFSLMTKRIVVSDPYLLTLLCVMEFWFAFSGIRTSIAQENKWRNPRPGMLPENLRDAPRIEVTNRRYFLFLTLIMAAPGVALVLMVPGRALEMYRFIAWVLILFGYYFLACTPPGPRDQQERETRVQLAHANP